jgi:hypothetical protein
MSNTTARRTRKTTATPADATPAPVATVDESTPDTGTDATTDTPDTSADTGTDTTDTSTTTYAIPAWTPDTDQAAYVASVGAAYRDADKTLKAAMRSAWARFQSSAIDALDMDRIALVRDINAVLVSSKPTVEVDPADAYLVRIRALRMAADRLTDAFGEAHGADAHAALLARLDGTLTDAERDAVNAMADKLATVPTGRRTGPQRSVEAHIRSALDAAPAGTILTCAQVHNHRSDAYGPDESPSVGAIGAAWGREMDGIESVHNDAKVKGFRIKA